MSTKAMFDSVSARCSEITTKRYSTSFSLGIKFLDKKLHEPIYGIYGFVRFADEIVDTFHDYNKIRLLARFRADTYDAIEEGISLNPILNSFQHTVRKYNIGRDLIDTFLQSMEMDLDKQLYDRHGYETYILGSAEVVGLMCLRVFLNGDDAEYERLKPYAMSLGAAFQKVNFLRDVQADFDGLGRTYFPGVNLASFSQAEKRQIEKEIAADFDHAIIGIRMLPGSSRRGVFLAYLFYRNLFNKIKGVSADAVMKERIRVPNRKKIEIMFSTLVRHQLNML